MVKVNLHDIFSRSAHRCCNYTYPSDKPTFYGLLTLSVPLLYVSAVLYVLLLPFYVVKLVKPNTLLSIKRIIALSVKLVNETPLLPGPKRIICSYLKILPETFTNLVQRYFNLFILTFLWLLITGFLILGVYMFILK